MSVERMVVKIASPDLGGQGVNVWHLRSNGEIFDGASINDRIDAVHAFYTAFAPYTSSDTTISFDGETVRVDGDTPTIHSGLHTWSVSGSTSTQNLPPANCAVMGWRTTLATKSARGRTFLGPIAADVNASDGTLDSGFITTMMTAAEDLITGNGDVGNGSTVVWSPKLSVAYDVTGAAMRDRFAVLRSRRD